MHHLGKMSHNLGVLTGIGTVFVLYLERMLLKFYKRKINLLIRETQAS